MSDEELKELRERLTLAKALGHVDVDAEVADALLAEIDFRREENATIQYFADQDKEEIDRLRAEVERWQADDKQVAIERGQALQERDEARRQLATAVGALGDIQRRHNALMDAAGFSQLCGCVDCIVIRAALARIKDFI